jgi:hypothetical protein
MNVGEGKDLHSEDVDQWTHYIALTSLYAAKFLQL